MKPPLFEMIRPETIEEALDLLARLGPDARPLAGGQSLVPMMNLRMAGPAYLIDLNRIESLAGIHVDAARVRVGAMTRQANLLAHPKLQEFAPLLASAMPNMGHVQTRSRGTIGGSLAHADPSAELALSMVTLDADFLIRSSGKTRTVRARDFFVDVFTTTVESDELLVEISWPRAPQRTRASFREYARRHGDFAIASATAQLTPVAGSMQLSAGIGGISVKPHFCESLCNRLDASISADAVDWDAIDALVDAELDQLDLLSDLQADANQRRLLAKTALLDCLKDVLQ